MTARELLVEVAGADHALHTVVGKFVPKREAISFVCTCGTVCTLEANTRSLLALQNVPVIEEP